MRKDHFKQKGSIAEAWKQINLLGFEKREPFNLLSA